MLVNDVDPFLARQKVRLSGVSWVAGGIVIGCATIARFVRVGLRDLCGRLEGLSVLCGVECQG